MANFQNYSKLQLIVARTSSTVALTVSGSATAGETISILGNDITTTAADDAATIAGNIVTVLDAVTGISASAAAGVVTVVYDADTYVGTISFTAPDQVVSDDVTYDYVMVVNDLKHSEYSDDAAGLSLATEAMYDLVLSSANTDTVQIQKLALNDTATTLVATEITAAVVGTNYTVYTT